MVERQGDEQHSQNQEHGGPGQLHIAGGGAQAAGQVDQRALAGDHREPIKRAAHADERRLPVLRQAQHVKAVGGDVVGGRTEGDQPEHGQAELKKMGQRRGQGDQRG